MRNIINLKHNWKFKLGGDSEKFAWYKGFPDNFGDWKDVSVPHDWSVEYPFTQSESSGTGYVVGGVGWYRTSFRHIPKENQHVTVTFEGVYNNSKVWINSNYLGKRPYGYSTFIYDITPFLSPDGNNVIAVQVNHTETADSRWFTGSGIVRDVYVTVRDIPFVEDYGIQVITESLDTNKAEIYVTSAVSSENAKITHRVFDPDGNEAAVTAADYAGGARIGIKSPAIWSCETPNLYMLKSQVIDENGNLTDEVDTFFGIRTVLFDPDRGFFLNGINMKLKGVCVHHDAGALGAAVPREIWRHRLTALRECGCNAIRTSHNPPDTTLLDLCDEMGFLVMDEAFDEWEMPKNKWWQGHNVNPPKLNGYYEDFPAWGERDIKTMVLRDRNHPCIITWSIGNEVDYPNDPYVHYKFDTVTGNNDAGKNERDRRFDINRPNAERLTTIARKLTKWIKECDTSRPVTAALAFPEMSTLIGYMQALDIAGYNYKEQFYEEHHKSYPNHVIYGSENGHGWDQWAAVKDNDYICGQFLWTGIDYLGEAHGWPSRASGAGLITLAGFKKDRWYHRKAMWVDASREIFTKIFVKHTDTGEGRRRWQPSYSHWNFREGDVMEVFCFTNCDSGELYINGEKAAVGVFDKGMINFGNVGYVSGQVKVICYKDGVECTDLIETCGEPAKITSSVYVYNAEETVRIELQLCDKDGNAVSHRDLSVKVSVTEGKLLGIENGNISDLTPYTSDTRNTSEGKLAVYVRKDGAAQVYAESPDKLFNSLKITL